MNATLRRATTDLGNRSTPFHVENFEREHQPQGHAAALFMRRLMRVEYFRE